MNMSKITINIQDGITDLEAIDLVRKSIKEGKVSKGLNGAQYCFSIYFRTPKISVHARKSKAGTNIFNVVKSKLNTN